MQKMWNVVLLYHYSITLSTRIPDKEDAKVANIAIPGLMEQLQHHLQRNIRGKSAAKEGRTPLQYFFAP